MPGPAPRTPKRISANGVKFIASFEGFRPDLYDDPAEPPNATIGFGHRVHDGPVDGSETKTRVTKAQALALLRTDCAAAAAAVARLVTRPLTQPQFDALASFAYNCGPEALAESTLLAEVNAGRDEAVAGAFAMWVKGAPGGPDLPGLVRRRRAEASLYATGRYQSRYSGA